MSKKITTPAPNAIKHIKNGMLNVSTEPKLENAFKRVQVPADAIVFVLKPGEVENSSLVSYFRSQGYEIKPVEEVVNVNQLMPSEAAEFIIERFKNYPPEAQNAMFKVLFQELAISRDNECQKAAEAHQNTAKNREVAETNRMDLLHFMESLQKGNAAGTGLKY
jgi:hypothetical protein